MIFQFLLILSFFWLLLSRIWTKTEGIALLTWCHLALWCSGYHYCTSSFNKFSVKTCCWCVKDLRWWEAPTMVPAGASLNAFHRKHSTKIIHHRHHHHQMLINLWVQIWPELRKEVRGATRNFSEQGNFLGIKALQYTFHIQRRKGKPLRENFWSFFS